MLPLFSPVMEWIAKNILITVTAAWKEPLSGWIDNLNGPTGLLAGAGKGILRSLLCYRNLIADLIPVDIAINLLISVAWHTATARYVNFLFSKQLI